MLLDRYRIQRQLGQGGQGAVFEAVDTVTGSRVAVKCAGLGGEADEFTRRQFEREGMLLRALNHPGLPRIFDVSTEGDVCALVMEYVEGEDLAAARARRGAPFDVREVVGWAHRLLDILEYLHAQAPPVFHRDVKPANIKVLPDGRVVLLDFGLARASQRGLGATANSIVGYTETFAPFEQTQGEAVGADGDLFSLGATLYWLLAPDPAPNAAARVFAIALGRPDPLRELDAVAPAVPAFVAAAVRRALEIRPFERFQSVAEMRDALSGIRAEEPELATRVRRKRVTVAVPGPARPERVAVSPVVEPTSGPREIVAAPRARRWPAITAALLLIAGAAAGSLALLEPAPRSVPPPPAQESPAPPPAPVPAPSTFHTELQGAVGARQGLRMRLERAGSKLSGTFVWADANGIGDFSEAVVRGTVEPDGSAVLTEYGAAWEEPDRVTGTFIGSVLADPTTGALSFEGAWSAPSGGQQAAFRLDERDLGLPDGADVVARRRELRGHDVSYRVEAVYPAIASRSVPHAERFNAAVEETVDETVGRWVREVQDDRRDEESRLSMRYEVSYGGEELISVRFFVESYLGADEGFFWDKEPRHEYAFDAMTFDFRSGRRVDLEELFHADTPYRERLADLALEALRERGVDVSREDLEGPALAAWNLVPEGLVLSIAPDEIAPYSLRDLTVLVEHEALHDLYRNGSIASRARSGDQSPPDPRPVPIASRTAWRRPATIS